MDPSLETSNILVLASYSHYIEYVSNYHILLGSYKLCIFFASFLNACHLAFTQVYPFSSASHLKHTRFCWVGLVIDFKLLVAQLWNCNDVMWAWKAKYPFMRKYKYDPNIWIFFVFQLKCYH